MFTQINEGMYGRREPEAQQMGKNYSFWIHRCRVIDDVNKYIHNLRILLYIYIADIIIRLHIMKSYSSQH